MKIERLFIYCLLATTCLFTACDNEMTADGDGVCTPLPEGMYPLTLTATQTGDEVQTRVSENSDGTSSAWTNGDQIKVKITGNGNDAETTCTLDASGQVTASNPELFWKTNGTSTVTAWYPTDGTVNLADQRGGLKYVLKATATGASYKSNVALSFAHQLAKVRVKLTGEKASDVTDVKIKSYTTCTNMQGEVSNAVSVGEITMHKAADKTFEANVVPGYEIKEFKVKDGDWVNLTASVTPVKSGWHEVTITVSAKGPTEIQPGPDGNYTVNEGSDVIIKGKDSPITGQIIIKGTAQVTLDGVNISSTQAIKIESGTPTIILQGENIIHSTSGAGIEISNNSNVIIDGKNTGKLTVTCAGDGAAGIQSKGSNCNIQIMNATIIATGSTNKGYGYDGGAGIGGGCNGSIGNIEIKNSTVTATGKAGAAAIGLGNCWGAGVTYTMGTVTITNSRITANVEKDGENVYGACIGFGAIDGGVPKAICGSIIISSGESWENFISRLHAGEGGYKIGKNSNANSSSKSEWGGVTFNAEIKAGSNTNGIQ